MASNRLNKELYSGKLFKTWSKKNNLLEAEHYFIAKYVSNKKSKVIEARTGCGRIIFEIEKLGFTKKKQIKSKVNFKTADAIKLNFYADINFDYLICLQQVLCFIEKENLTKALKEVHRIGNSNSVYLFSFLNWNSKFYNPILSLLVNFFRFIRFEKTSKQNLPWLSIGEKFNWKLIVNKKVYKDLVLEKGNDENFDFYPLYRL